MECLVEARTGVGAICAFDAAGLPASFDRLVVDPDKVERDALAATGKAWIASTAGNGAWRVQVRVDERDAPAQAGPAVHRGTLSVPSGRLWICGAECLARDPAAAGARTPQGGLARQAMGDCLTVPAGTYALSVFAADAAGASAAHAAGARSLRRQVARALEFGGYLSGGIGVASAAWTLYALWFADTDETWQGVLRQNVPAILAFLVVGWAMLYGNRMIDAFESARELAPAPEPVDRGADAPPAWVLVLSRIEPVPAQAD